MGDEFSALRDIGEGFAKGRRFKKASESLRERGPGLASTEEFEQLQGDVKKGRVSFDEALKRIDPVSSNFENIMVRLGQQEVAANQAGNKEEVVRIKQIQNRMFELFGRMKKMKEKLTDDPSLDINKQITYGNVYDALDGKDLKILDALSSSGGFFEEKEGFASLSSNVKNEMITKVIKKLDNPLLEKETLFEQIDSALNARTQSDFDLDRDGKRNLIILQAKEKPVFFGEPSKITTAKAKTSAIIEKSNEAVKIATTAVKQGKASSADLQQTIDDMEKVGAPQASVEKIRVLLNSVKSKEKKKPRAVAASISASPINLPPMNPPPINPPPFRR